jgi:hypothetical protein
MTDSPDLGAIFAEFMNAQLNSGAPPEPPPEPEGPRAPRVDYSQGSSSMPSHVDPRRASAAAFAHAIHECIGRPLWTPL